MVNQVSALAVWIGPVPGAKKGRLVWEEVKRAIIAALTSGATISLAQVILQAISQNAGTIFPKSSGVVIAACTLCIELIRRYNHHEMTEEVKNGSKE